MTSFRRVPRLLLGAVAVMFGLLACESDESPSPSPTRGEITVEDSMTIVRVLNSDDRFSTLRAALDSTNLDSVLAGDGPFTLFAPPNDAFAALPPGTMETLLAERHERLRTILAQHIVEEWLSRDDLSTSRSVVALSGDTLSLRSTQQGLSVEGVSVVDGDVEASNGLLHVVERVLPPPDADRP